LPEKSLLNALNGSCEVPRLPIMESLVKAVIGFRRVALHRLLKSKIGLIIQTAQAEGNAEIVVNFIQREGLAELLKFGYCLIVIRQVQVIQTHEKACLRKILVRLRQFLQPK